MPRHRRSALHDEQARRNHWTPPRDAGYRGLMAAHDDSRAGDLGHLEGLVLDGMDLVVAQLDRALESLVYQDVELAGMVVTDDQRIDDRFLEVHQGTIALLGRGVPDPESLRLCAALLHVVRCVERMGDQCANIAKLVPLSGHEPPKDKETLDVVQRMGLRARAQVLQTRDAVRMRNLDLARDLVRQDAEVNRLNRVVFQRALDIGDELEMREWGMFMILVARCLERIGDNTVDIAEQIEFVITGIFRAMDESEIVSSEPDALT
jgi:phosphate transport system protein